jgi:alanine racemase
MGGFSRGEEEDIVQYQLTPALWDWNHVELLENAAEKLAIKERIAVHLNVNTGMNQLGVDIAGLPAILEALQSAPHIFLEGIFSHFAASEVVDGPHGERQLQLFGEALAKAEEMGIKAPLRHIANSSALASRPQSWFNLVRPGLAIYGYFLPFSSIVTGHADWSLDLPVKPALAWKTRIIQTREVAAGLSVGGSSGYVTEFPTKVAVLSVGYGDGLNHHLSSHGRVIIQNDYAAIIGNIGMDVTTVDVTGIPGVEVGDEVIIIGETEKRKITAWEHAGIAGTIPQEVLCNISSRVFRKYVE